MEQDETSAEAQPIAAPAPLPRRRGRDLLMGLGQAPAKRLQNFDPETVETVVGTWLYETRRPRYAQILDFAGAGDKGRDRAAYVVGNGQDPWDNFQCKRYNAKLAPTDMWLEFGKVVFYVTRGDYSTPRTYYFVAPKGMGPKALDLIGKPEAIRSGLLAKWDTYCSDLCPLDEIREALNDFHFPEFAHVGAEEIVDDLKDSSMFPYFFGGGLTKVRPAVKTPPSDIKSHELPYVQALLDAYNDHSNVPLDSVETALSTSPYANHLTLSRRSFYCAESLREFSKDAFPDPEVFRELQDLVHDGVVYTHARSHADGYERVLATCEQAVKIELGDHPLAGDVTTADRGGICHQLANSKRLKWVA